MSNLLQAGAAALAAGLQQSAATQIVYRRGADSISLPATLGSQLLRVTTQQGATRTERTDRDFVVQAVQLILADAQTVPQDGDTVDLTIGDTTYRYEVEPLGSGEEPSWRYADPFRTLIRVHTKFLGTV